MVIPATFFRKTERCAVFTRQSKQYPVFTFHSTSPYFTVEEPSDSTFVGVEGIIITQANPITRSRACFPLLSLPRFSSSITFRSYFVYDVSAYTTSDVKYQPCHNNTIVVTSHVLDILLVIFILCFHHDLLTSCSR